MKLLIVTQVVDRNDDLLGAFHQWIYRFAEIFESVEVICLIKGEYDFPGNVRVHSLGKEEKHSRFQYVTRFYKYVFKYRKNYDAVFVHMNPEYVVMAGLYWRLMGKTIFLWYAHKKGNYLRRIALRLVHRVVSVSKDSFIDNNSKKFIAVGHGIDPDLLDCEKERTVSDQKIILSIGRISPVKEYDRLLDAANIMQTELGFQDFRIQLVGGPANKEDHQYIKDLKKKAEGYGMADRVEFVGPVPNKNISQYICKADVFVSMQCLGGAGKSFLEAMAYGVPTVVCTPVFNPYLGKWKDLIFYNGKAPDFARKLKASLTLNDEEKNELSGVLRGIVSEHHNLKKLVRRIKEEFEKIEQSNN